MPRHSLTVPKAVWSVLAPLSPTERDRVLAAALAPLASARVRVLVRDRDGRALDSCTPARARQLTGRGRARWVSYRPAVIRLLAPARGAPR